MIWSYSRPRGNSKTVAVDAAIGANRGVAALDDRLYFITDNAHLICLQRISVTLLWDVRMPPQDAPGLYGGTAAPLIAGRLVIAGVSGGDQGIRGFLDAYDPMTGRRVWRFWTVPKPGDPTYYTWGGDPSPQGGPTWSIGSHEPGTGILYVGLSPIKHVDAINVSGALLIHGRDDTVVSFDQSTAMLDAMKHAKKEVEMVVLKNEDHWLSHSETRLQMLQSSVAFLRAHNPPD